MAFSYARKNVDTWQQSYRRISFSGAALYSVWIMKRFVRISRVDDAITSWMPTGEDRNEQRNFQQGNCYIRLRCLMPDRVTIVLMRRGIDYLEEYLGVFLGYMSGPLPVSAITKE